MGEIQQIKDGLKREDGIKDLGKTKFILGIQVHCHSNGGIFLTPARVPWELLLRLGNSDPNDPNAAKLAACRCSRGPRPYPCLPLTLPPSRQFPRVRHAWDAPQPVLRCERSGPPRRAAGQLALGCGHPRPGVYPKGMLDFHLLQPLSGLAQGSGKSVRLPLATIEAPMPSCAARSSTIALGTSA